LTRAGHARSTWLSRAEPRHKRSSTGALERAAFVVQNGNVYNEGLDKDFWKQIKTYWQEKTAEREKPLPGLFPVRPSLAIFGYFCICHQNRLLAICKPRYFF
jgi:hypothetical protein